MEEIKHLLKEIKPEIDVDDPRDFIGTGQLDSFDIIMLVSMLDNIYDISINGLDIIPENFSNIQNIWNLIGKYRGLI